MKLYHGTNNNELIKILKSGYLDNTKAFEDTLYIDKLIEEYLGRKLTNDAIYLSDDIVSTQLSFDYEFGLTVDVDLDREKLFVVEYNYRDEIMAYDNDCREGVEAIENYIKSFISYDEYINKSLKYKSPEFLYFDIVNIEHLDKEVLNHLEESEEFKEELKIFSKKDKD